MAFVVLLCLFSPVFSPQVSAAPVNNAFKHLQSAPKFWHISDLHLDPTYHVTEDHTKVCFSSKGVPAMDPGVFGDFLCDSPYQLILSAFTYMKQADLQPEFIIWTGDSPPHVPKEELSTDVVINVIANMTHTIRQFFPQLPVYPALGNHDYWPQDQLPTSANAIYDAVAKLWSPWLNPEAVATLQKGGFYSLVIKPGLRLVSLNTNLYYSPNQVTVNMTDPAGQFQWLQETLELSRQKMEKDIWQFYLNLTEANLEQKSEWKLEYIMTEAFDIDDIQPHNLHELALKFEQPQSKAFDKYFNHFMVNYNFSITCEGLCKMIQVCAVHFLDQETYSQCIAKSGV
ncbi:acid sphingomyelinase-like phosphodiesterase 3a [Labeo rohita]|uniref:Acid sphingomyelinase-like phosphodiesterase 3a n=1 Tax=Labeo rohita TaxID=84645 RepID=A0A498LC71_LABRO|nr:acid sphingomyelinase-like phosphodiesterase 3a [Labeo rohita]